MGDLRKKNFSDLVLTLTLLILSPAAPHITFINAELATTRNIEHKFRQCQNQDYLEQWNKPKTLQCNRRELLAIDLNMQDEEDIEINSSHTTAYGRNSIWTRESEDPISDTLVKRMRDQIIMAEVYSKLEGSKKKTDLYTSLIRQSKECVQAMGDADLDIELQPRAFKQAKKMDHILSIAEKKFQDCAAMIKKLRVMIQEREDNVNAQDKKTRYLAHLTSKMVPKPLHCLAQLLTVDSFLQGYSGDRRNVDMEEEENLEDPSLYHYAIFSDNVLTTSVVVNSAVQNAKDSEKHVFHIVTDGLNFRAMRMWFDLNRPAATVEVKSIDDFLWLNPSNCPVIPQLQVKEYHFKENNNKIKHINPKYLSILNHLRFYLPAVFPKLDKILFLDDDVVVQRDLTPLWSIDMDGFVNGAVVAACKQGFHFHTLADYINFNNPSVAGAKFDPDSCAWAFGMNLFDLQRWRLHNITDTYHHWLHINEKQKGKLWKLGSLPPGLVAFYNRTYRLDAKWHVLGLGYDPEVSLDQIKKAAVIHYSGNCKPWLDCGIAEYKGYWLMYVNFDSPQIRHCKIREYFGNV